MIIYVCLYSNTYARDTELVTRARECCARSPEESATRLALHYPGCENEIARHYPACTVQLERAP